MEKAALWKIEKKGIRASRHTRSAASSSTVFLSRDVVCAGTGMTKANYCCHFIKGIRLARAEKALTGMCKKPVEIGPAKRAGRFPLNSNI